ncbi:MAG: transporter [Thermodesulfobacteriota bacterium]|nr:transporter [Thermodesulfobacteriota bacterium]
MICSKTLTFALTLTLILTSTSVFAAHPLITDDAGTQGKGKFQLELNGEYGHEKEDGVKEQAFEISSIITYGLFDNLDLVLGIPYQSIRTKEKVEEEWEKNREGGLSDISFEVKWRFYEIEGFSFAVKPGITLPAGNERKGLGAGRVTYSFHSIVTKEIGPLAFHANFGYFRNENKVNKRKDLWHVSLATEVEVVKDLKIVGNIGMERNPEKDSHRNPAFLLGGVIYSFTKYFDIDFGVKYGLNKPETDLTLLVGIAFRF